MIWYILALPAMCIVIFWAIMAAFDETELYQYKSKGKK